jgi:hypothetical protein
MSRLSNLILLFLIITIGSYKAQCRVLSYSMNKPPCDLGAFLMLDSNSYLNFNDSSIRTPLYFEAFNLLNLNSATYLDSILQTNEIQRLFGNSLIVSSSTELFSEIQSVDSLSECLYIVGYDESFNFKYSFLLNSRDKIIKFLEYLINLTSANIEHARLTEIFRVNLDIARYCFATWDGRNKQYQIETKKKKRCRARKAY